MLADPSTRRERAGRETAAGEPHDPDFETGLAVQRILDAVARSDERREWVELRG